MVFYADIPSKLSIDNLNIVHEQLTKAVACKYKAFGMQLDLEYSQIEALEHRNGKVIENFLGMMEKWKNEGNWTDGPEALEKVFEALESNSVGQKALARDLRKKWKDHSRKFNLLVWSFDPY